MIGSEIARADRRGRQCLRPCTCPPHRCTWTRLIGSNGADASSGGRDDGRGIGGSARVGRAATDTFEY